MLDDFLLSQLYWISWICISLICLNFAVEACSFLEKLICLIILVKHFLQSSYAASEHLVKISEAEKSMRTPVCTIVMLLMSVCIQSGKTVAVLT